MFSMIFFLFFAFSHSNMSINHKIDKKKQDSRDVTWLHVIGRTPLLGNRQSCRCPFIITLRTMEKQFRHLCRLLTYTSRRVFRTAAAGPTFISCVAAHYAVNFQPHAAGPTRLKNHDQVVNGQSPSWSTSSTAVVHESPLLLYIFCFKNILVKGVA